MEPAAIRHWPVVPPEARPVPPCAIESGLERCVPSTQGAAACPPMSPVSCSPPMADELAGGSWPEVATPATFVKLTGIGPQVFPVQPRYSFWFPLPRKLLLLPGTHWFCAALYWYMSPPAGGVADRGMPPNPTTF